MALLIKTKGEKKIKIQGTDIELASVYARIEATLKENGQAVSAGLYIHQSKAQYESGSSILNTNIASSGYSFNVVNQSLQTIHEGVKVILVEQGFDVNIVDL